MYYRQIINKFGVNKTTITLAYEELGFPRVQELISDL